MYQGQEPLISLVLVKLLKALMVMMIDDMDSSGRLRKRNAGTHLHVNEQLRTDFI